MRNERTSHQQENAESDVGLPLHRRSGGDYRDLSRSEEYREPSLRRLGKGQ